MKKCFRIRDWGIESSIASAWGFHGVFLVVYEYQYIALCRNYRFTQTTLFEKIVCLICQMNWRDRFEIFSSRSIYHGGTRETLAGRGAIKRSSTLIKQPAIKKGKE